MPSPPGNGESFIEMVFNVTKHDKNSFAYGDIEVALVDFSEPEAILASDKFFSALGYMDNGKQMVCCDAKAIDVVDDCSVITLDGHLHNGGKVDHSRLAQVRLSQGGREDEVVRSWNHPL